MYIHLTCSHTGTASSLTGLAESISFNVSSAVPPSPIPPTASLDSYTARPSRYGGAKSTRRSTRKVADVQNTKSTTATATATVQATGKGSGRPGRKRAKTAGVAIVVPESTRELEQGADISMLPPNSE